MDTGHGRERALLCVEWSVLWQQGTRHTKGTHGQFLRVSILQGQGKTRSVPESWTQATKRTHFPLLTEDWRTKEGGSLSQGPDQGRTRKEEGILSKVSSIWRTKFPSVLTFEGRDIWMFPIYTTTRRTHFSLLTEDWRTREGKVICHKDLIGWGQGRRKESDKRVPSSEGPSPQVSLPLREETSEGSLSSQLQGEHTSFPLQRTEGHTLEGRPSLPSREQGQA